MAVIMKVLCLAVTLLPVSVTLEWTTTTSPPNGTTIPACTGQDVTLAWNYTTATEDHVMNVEWHYKPQTGGDEVLLATQVMGNFFAAPGFPVHLQFIPNAGIRLVNVASADAGWYSVHVNVNLHGSVVTDVQTLHVVVSDASMTMDGQLHASMLPDAAYDNTTQQFHVQLSCGDFKDMWTSKVFVLWKTPSGQTVPSTARINGSFLLSVSNPVVSGEYTCAMDGTSPASVCVKSGSPVDRGATVNVDGTAAKFTLVEAQMTAMETRHQQEMTSLENRYQQELSALKQENINMKQQLEASVTKLSQTLSFQPENCQQAQSRFPSSGVVSLLIGAERVSAYCDQDTDMGGWTVIQRRLDGSVDFHIDWQHYEDGFGNVSGEYWLGLRNIHAMTSDRNYTLRVDLEDFNGSTAFAAYGHFSIDGPSDLYRLHVNGYNGTAGSDPVEGMSWDNNMAFSTRDRDNDRRSDVKCAARYHHGGWWFNDCGLLNPNGRYLGPGHNGSHDAMSWYPWKQYTALKRIEMKLRPV